MDHLPIDTIVKVNGYGIGIIVDVLYSSKLYRVSFQGEKYLISFMMSSLMKTWIKEVV